MGSTQTTKDSTLRMSALRRWNSDPQKYDETYVYQHVASGGVNPFIQMGAQSDDNNGYIEVSASGSSSQVLIVADRLREFIGYDQGANPVYMDVFMTQGTVGQTTSIAANGYHDFNVSFGHTYASAPAVNLTIYSTTTATTSFDCDIYLRSVSTTGFTARIINRESTSRSPGFHWQAIG